MHCQSYLVRVRLWFSEHCLYDQMWTCNLIRLFTLRDFFFFFNILVDNFEETRELSLVDLVLDETNV